MRFKESEVERFSTGPQLFLPLYYVLFMVKCFRIKCPLLQISRSKHKVTVQSNKTTDYTQTKFRAELDLTTIIPNQKLPAPQLLFLEDLSNLIHTSILLLTSRFTFDFKKHLFNVLVFPCLNEIFYKSTWNFKGLWWFTAKSWQHTLSEAVTFEQEFHRVPPAVACPKEIGLFLLPA